MYIPANSSGKSSKRTLIPDVRIYVAVRSGRDACISKNMYTHTHIYIGMYLRTAADSALKRRSSQMKALV